MNLPDNMTLKAIVEKPISEGDSGSTNQNNISLSEWFSWPGRLALLLVIVLSPWAFGSVESWAQFWMTIGLLVGLAFWWFETALNNRSSQVVPYIALLVVLGLGIGLVQSVSLPAWMSDLMIGRQQEIYTNFVDDQQSGATISLNRGGTWNQIRLLVIALSGLLLGSRYFRSKRDLVLLMSVVAFNGAAIAFFGVVHKLTSNGKLFWVYEMSRGGLPFGPFVNRNNAAGYLLICLSCAIGLIPIVMANHRESGARNIISKEIPIWRQLYFVMLEFIAELKATKIAVLFSVILIASGVVTSMSRGGVVAMLVASIGTIVVYGMARRPKNSGLFVIPLMILVLALSGWIGFGDQLIARFNTIDVVNVSDSDVRVQHWKETWPVVADMGWFGSGLGSYEGVHRLYRKSRENVVFVYAENQYFQSVVEAGWPGFVIFLLAWLFAYHYAATAIFRGSSATTIGVGTMGVFLVGSQAIASLFDFGLYIAANMLLFAVLTGFLAYHAHALAGRLKTKSWLRFKTPNYVAQVLVLILFAATTMVALEMNRRAAIERLMKPRAVNFDRQNMTLEKIDQRKAEITKLIQRSPTVDALNYVGELWLHRSRVAMFDSMTKDPEFESSIALMDDAEKTRFTNNLWQLTDIQRVQENAFSLRREGTRYEADRYRNSPAIRENLKPALKCFLLSQQASPLQPVVHLRIGEIQAVIGDFKKREGDVSIERAVSLAPSNASFRKVAGVYYLQSGNVEAAIPHLRRNLELEPSRYRNMLNLIAGRANRAMERVSDELITEIIPDNPAMIFTYATRYLPDDSEAKKLLLREAAEILSNAPHRRRADSILLGNIRLEQGDLLAAKEQFRFALVSQPNDPKTRYKRAQLLVKLGDLDDLYEALGEAEYLKNHSQGNATYTKFFENVQSLIEKQDKNQD